MTARRGDALVALLLMVVSSLCAEGSPGAAARGGEGPAKGGIREELRTLLERENQNGAMDREVLQATKGESSRLLRRCQHNGENLRDELNQCQRTVAIQQTSDHSAQQEDQATRQGLQRLLSPQGPGGERQGHTTASSNQPKSGSGSLGEAKASKSFTRLKKACTQLNMKIKCPKRPNTSELQDQASALKHQLAASLKERKQLENKLKLDKEAGQTASMPQTCQAGFRRCEIKSWHEHAPSIYPDGSKISPEFRKAFVKNPTKATGIAKTPDTFGVSERKRDEDCLLSKSDKPFEKKCMSPEWKDANCSPDRRSCGTYGQKKCCIQKTTPLRDWFGEWCPHARGLKPSKDVEKKLHKAGYTVAQFKELCRESKENPYPSTSGILCDAFLKDKETNKVCSPFEIAIAMDKKMQDSSKNCGHESRLVPRDPAYNAYGKCDSKLFVAHDQDCEGKNTKTRKFCKGQGVGVATPFEVKVCEDWKRAFGKVNKQDNEGMIFWQKNGPPDLVPKAWCKVPTPNAENRFGLQPMAKINLSKPVDPMCAFDLHSWCKHKAKLSEPQQKIATKRCLSSVPKVQPANRHIMQTCASELNQTKADICLKSVAGVSGIAGVYCTRRVFYSARKEWRYNIPVWNNPEMPACSTVRKWDRPSQTELERGTKLLTELSGTSKAPPKCMRSCPNALPCQGPCFKASGGGGKSACKCYDGYHTTEILRDTVMKNSLDRILEITLGFLDWSAGFFCQSCTGRVGYLPGLKSPSKYGWPGKKRAQTMAVDSNGRQTVQKELAKLVVKSEKPYGDLALCGAKENWRAGCPASCQGFCPMDPRHFAGSHKIDKTASMPDFVKYSSTGKATAKLPQDPGECPTHYTWKRWNSKAGDYSDTDDTDVNVRVPKLPGETGYKCHMDPKEGQSYFFHPIPKRWHWRSGVPSLLGRQNINPDPHVQLGRNRLCNRDGTRPANWKHLYHKGSFFKGGSLQRFTDDVTTEAPVAILRSKLSKMKAGSKKHKSMKKHLASLEGWKRLRQNKISLRQEDLQESDSIGMSLLRMANGILKDHDIKPSQALGHVMSFLDEGEEAAGFGRRRRKPNASVADGRVCKKNKECKSGKCAGNGGGWKKGTCKGVVKQANGAGCKKNSECTSGICKGNANGLKTGKCSKTSYTKDIKTKAEGTIGLALVKKIGRKLYSLIEEKVWYTKGSGGLFGRLNWVRGGQQQLQGGDIGTGIFLPILKKFLMGDFGRWTSKIAPARMFTELAQNFKPYRREISRAVLVLVMRIVTSEAYTCTECGPRYTSDALLEWMCAMFAGRALTPGSKTMIFRSIRRNVNYYEVMVGKMETSEYRKAGGQGGAFQLDLDDINPKPGTNALSVRYYDLRRSKNKDESLHPPPKGVDPWKHSDCLAKIKFSMLLCSTCCCKGGLTKAGLGVGLVKRRATSNCDAWFGVVQAWVGVATGMIRAVQSGKAFNGKCMDTKIA